MNQTPFCREDLSILFEPSHKPICEL